MTIWHLLALRVVTANILAIVYPRTFLPSVPAGPHSEIWREKGSERSNLLPDRQRLAMPSSSTPRRIRAGSSTRTYSSAQLLLWRRVRLVPKTAQHLGKAPTLAPNAV